MDQKVLTSPRGHALVHHVMNVKISVPIDMIDFWSTESMGWAVKPFNCQTDKLSPIEQSKANFIQDSYQEVENQWLILYPWKRDPSALPDNKSQAERKLEASEWGLTKNPEHA